MAAIVIIAIIVICALICRRWDNTILAFGLIDIFLRLANFIGNNTIKEIRNFVNKYFPNSIESIIRDNSKGTLETVLVWIYVILMIIFFIIVLKMFLRRIRH